MLRLSALFPVMLLAIQFAPSASAANGLEPGAYDIAVRLELPHVEDSGATRTTTLCIARDRPALGLKVLSANNPLANCPASSIVATDAELTFEIACPGGNAAVASARYKLNGDRFQGRISMKMGGKNMTMTETQAGRRTGLCPPPS